MNPIRATVFMAHYQGTPPMNVVYGSDVPIELTVTDLPQFPANSTAAAYAKGFDTETVYINQRPVSVSGNKITFTPDHGFFVPGDNVLIVKVRPGGETGDGYTFPLTVNCKPNPAWGKLPANPVDIKGYAEAAKASEEQSAAVLAEIKANYPMVATLSNDVNRLKEDLTQIAEDMYNFYDVPAETIPDYFIRDTGNAAARPGYTLYRILLPEGAASLYCEVASATDIPVAYAFYTTKSFSTGNATLISPKGAHGFVKVPDGSKYIGVVVHSGEQYRVATYTMKEEKKPLPTNVITVGKDNCDYQTINEAINNANDSTENPVTILIYPGIYKEVCIVGGYRNLSFVGVNRDTCIIKDTSGRYENSPLRISGNFTVQNLTLIADASEADPGWTATNVNGNRPSYAIHIDDPFNVSGYGYVNNCKIYCECLNAVGMGLRANQTVVFENCEIIRNTKRSDFIMQSKYRGALACHSATSGQGSEVNEHLIVKGCYIENNLESAVQLFKVYSTSPMDVALINNTLLANGAVQNTLYLHGDVTDKASYLTITSHGNNDSVANYE